MGRPGELQPSPDWGRAGGSSAGGGDTGGALTVSLIPTGTWGEGAGGAEVQVPMRLVGGRDRGRVAWDGLKRDLKSRERVSHCVFLLS